MSLIIVSSFIMNVYIFCEFYFKLNSGGASDHIHICSSRNQLVAGCPDIFCSRINFNGTLSSNRSISTSTSKIWNLSFNNRFIASKPFFQADLTLDIAVLFILAFLFLIVACFILLFELLVRITIPYAYLVVEISITFTILLVSNSQMYIHLISVYINLVRNVPCPNNQWKPICWDAIERLFLGISDSVSRLPYHFLADILLADPL